MTIPKLIPYTGQVANPDGSQTQTEFTQNMFDQLSYEAQLATQLDATIDGMNNAVDEVEVNAVSAENSASAAEAAASSAGYQGLWPDTGGSALKGETWQTQVGGTPTGDYFTALQNTTVDPVGDNVNWKVNVSANNIINPNLISNSSFDLAGGVAIPPDETPRSYSAGDELFSGFFAPEDLINVTYINGELNGDKALGGTGQLYTDIHKTEKQKLSTSTYTASIASSNGSSVEAGASFVDNVDYWRVTFDMSNTFSVKFEQGSTATKHELTQQPQLTTTSTYNIPSDFADLQTAFNTLNNSRLILNGYDGIINIESGHLLTGGLGCYGGDFSRWKITSDDPIVSLSPSFVGVDVPQNAQNGEIPALPLFYGLHSSMPVLSTIIDMGNNHGTGMLLIECETLLDIDCGVINAGFRGVQIRGGSFFSTNARFDGASGVGGRVQKAGKANFGSANFDNCCQTLDNTGDPLGAIYVSRSSIVEARNVSCKNSGANGILGRRSIITAVDADVSGAALDGIISESGAIIDATSHISGNVGGFNTRASNGGSIILSGANITNPSAANRVIQLNGGQATVNSATLVDGAPIANLNLYTGIGNFNTLTKLGVVNHVSEPGMIENGSNANGTWTKYSNGQMRCETGIKNIDTTVASGSYSGQIQKPLLPQTFVEVYQINPKVVGKTSAGGGGLDVFINSCSNNGAISNEWKVYNTGVQLDGNSTGLTINSVQVQMQVFGTWK